MPTPLDNNAVNNALVHAMPNVQQALLQFVNVTQSATDRLDPGSRLN